MSNNKVLEAFYASLNKKKLIESELLEIIEKNPQFIYDELQKADAPQKFVQIFKPYLEIIEQAISNRKKQFADGIIYNGKGEILMLLRASNASIEPGKWGLPGGHIDRGETPDSAVIREVLEETGLVVQSATLRHVKETKDITIFFYFCDVNPEQLSLVLDAFEHKNYKWVDRKELQTLDCIFDLKEVLNQIVFALPQNPVTMQIEKSDKLDEIDKAIDTIKEAFDNNQVTLEDYRDALSKAKMLKSNMSKQSQKDNIIVKAYPKYGYGKKKQVIQYRKKSGGYSYQQREVGIKKDERTKQQILDDFNKKNGRSLKFETKFVLFDRKTGERKFVLFNNIDSDDSLAFFDLNHFVSDSKYAKEIYDGTKHTEKVEYLTLTELRNKYKVENYVDYIAKHDTKCIGNVDDQIAYMKMHQADDDVKAILDVMEKGAVQTYWVGDWRTQSVQNKIPDTAKKRFPDISFAIETLEDYTYGNINVNWDKIKNYLTFKDHDEPGQKDFYRYIPFRYIDYSKIMKGEATAYLKKSESQNKNNYQSYSYYKDPEKRIMDNYSGSTLTLKNDGEVVFNIHKFKNFMFDKLSKAFDVDKYKAINNIKLYDETEKEVIMRAKETISKEDMYQFKGDRYMSFESFEAGGKDFEGYDLAKRITPEIAAKDNIQKVPFKTLLHIYPEEGGNPLQGKDKVKDFEIEFPENDTMFDRTSYAMPNARDLSLQSNREKIMARLERVETEEDKKHHYKDSAPGLYLDNYVRVYGYVNGINERVNLNLCLNFDALYIKNRLDYGYTKSDYFSKLLYEGKKDVYLVADRHFSENIKQPNQLWDTLNFSNYELK